MSRKMFILLAILLLALCGNRVCVAADTSSTTETTTLISIANDAVEATGSALSKLPFTYGAMVMFECGKTVELNDYIIPRQTIHNLVNQN